MTEDFKEVLRKKLPTEEAKISMILTLMGCSGHLTEFIGKNFDIKKLPIEIKYACALTAGNMISLTSYKECKILDSSNDYKMGEQTQERFYRLFRKIAILLYESLSDVNLSMGDVTQEDIFDLIQDDDEKQMQDVVHRILSGPETDPEVILVGCMAAIQSIIVEMENPKEEIESLCRDLLQGTLKRINEEFV